MSELRVTLRRVAPEDVAQLDREVVDRDTLARVTTIVDDVRGGGEASLRRWAERFGELSPNDALVFGREALEHSVAEVQDADRALLERTRERIAAFARAQLAAVAEVTVAVEGGEAGHTVVPVARAGCYAPGGRYPLPSSVLMTAVTAKEAGVPEVWVASPRPGAITRAAAAVAGADGLVAAGGAQAIAALAHGAGRVPACDVVVGPGNRWVTAAKKAVLGRVNIDMLAGPSELVVLADASANAELVAADLLAQAEHDPEALPVLVATERGVIEAVERALGGQLADLPTRRVAEAALANGFAVSAPNMETAIAVCDRLAPEHLHLVVSEPEEVAKRAANYGALFVGPASAEVLGDYGVGPNHTLPTGGSARAAGGLTVLDFLRVRTWLRMQPGTAAEAMARDAASLARLEGLEGHARAAEMRLGMEEVGE